MGRRGGSLKVWLGSIILFVGFIGFLLVEIQASEGSRKTTAAAAEAATVTSPAGNSRQLQQKGTDKTVVHPDKDLNYMSKRRVPNGPDPIHNRRAGKSKQPPGRA